MANTIHEAKKSLEGKILSSGYVTSIGTRQRDGGSYIRVGVLEEKNIADVQQLLIEGKWEGHRVEVIVRGHSEPHEHKT